jgi:hypothetical protein
VQYKALFGADPLPQASRPASDRRGGFAPGTPDHSRQARAGAQRLLRPSSRTTLQRVGLQGLPVTPRQSLKQRTAQPHVGPNVSLK